MLRHSRAIILILARALPRASIGDFDKTLMGPHEHLTKIRQLMSSITRFSAAYEHLMPRADMAGAKACRPARFMPPPGMRAAGELTMPRFRPFRHALR